MCNNEAYELTEGLVKTSIEYYRGHFWFTLVIFALGEKFPKVKFSDSTGHARFILARLRECVRPTEQSVLHLAFLNLDRDTFTGLELSKSLQPFIDNTKNKEIGNACISMLDRITKITGICSDVGKIHYGILLYVAHVTGLESRWMDEYDSFYFKRDEKTQNKKKALNLSPSDFITMSSLDLPKQAISPFIPVVIENFN